MAMADNKHQYIIVEYEGFDYIYRTYDERMVEGVAVVLPTNDGQRTVATIKKVADDTDIVKLFEDNPHSSVGDIREITELADNRSPEQKELENRMDNFVSQLKDEDLTLNPHEVHGMNLMLSVMEHALNNRNREE